jgi:CRISPR/Cas system CMR-associated protein Cmr5 small subunit
MARKKKIDLNTESVRQYVRAILEEDYGGDYGGDYGEDYGDFGGGGMGMDPGTAKLAKAFGLTGVANIFKTAAYGIERMSSKAQHLASVIVSGGLASFIPFFEGKYEKIDAAERKRAQAIKAKYKDVLAAVDKEFYDDDFKVASFMFNPVSYLAASAALKTPDAALDALDALSGRNNYVMSFTAALRDKFDIMDMNLTKSRSKSKSLSKLFGTEEDEFDWDSMFGESIERSLNEEKMTQANVMKKVLSQDKVRRALKNKKVKGMKEIGEKMVKDYIMQVVNGAKDSMNITSQDVLKAVSGKIDVDAWKALEDKERQGIEKMLLDQAKNAAKDVFKKKLASKAKGTPDELKRYIERGVQAIEAL